MLPSGNGPKPGSQRIRGLSFKQEYSSHGQQTSIFARMKARVNGQQRGRAPSMIQDIGKELVPPKDPMYRDRITIVMDLDETLIYAREGPLYARPGLDELLRYLKDNCEALVWTAGVKAYAQAVVRNIDKNEAIQHTVYRHRKWFTGQAGYNKDLTLLGRSLDTTLIIENTPDCVRGNELNGILVADYEGGELTDNTLPAILALITDLVERHKKEGITVPQYVQTSPFLSKQRIPTDIGDTMFCYCLDVNDNELFRLQKEQRQNKDLAQNQQRVVSQPPAPANATQYSGQNSRLATPQGGRMGGGVGSSYGSYSPPAPTSAYQQSSYLSYGQYSQPQYSYQYGSGPGTPTAGGAGMLPRINGAGPPPTHNVASLLGARRR